MSVMDLPEGWVQEKVTELSFHKEGYSCTITVEPDSSISIQIDDLDHHYAHGSYAEAHIPLSVWWRALMMAEFQREKRE